MIGKDILWFHAVIWPALLLALELPLPKSVYANGYFTIDGQKMSKSIGNVIDPIEMVSTYGADAVRYSVLRCTPFGEDGDISESKIADFYQKDLGNELGNLVQRTLSMINKYDVKIDRKENYFSLEEELFADLVPDTELQYEMGMKEYKFDQVLIAVWSLVKACNSFIDEKKPWMLAKEENHVELTRVLNVVYWQICKIAEKIDIFMPETSQKILDQTENLKPEVLFPRLEK
jgi:methionyl-tRNA synthetase